MAFQIKDFASIVASQINHARQVTDKVTDFQPGSVVRTLMEAPAVEVEELYLQFFLGLREAIPVATFLSFGFDRLPAARARGFVSVSVSTALNADLLVPRGTEFTSSDGRTYISSEPVVWPAGTNVIRIPIEATSSGLAGNIAAGAIVSSPFFDDAFSISNTQISSGRDEESDREREARFADFVESLSRGTVVACEYAVRQARVIDSDGNIDEYVTRIGTLENPGYVRIFAYSSRGVPSAALITDAQRRLDGWKDGTTGVVTPGFRAAGVRVDALPMVERVVDASIGVSMFPGYSLSNAVKQQMSDVFATAVRGVLPGEVLQIGTLVELLLSVAGVRAVVPAVNENIVCAVHEALIPGTLNVSAL